MSLEKAATQLGFTTKPVRVSRENFNSSYTLPIITHILSEEEFTHFVVINKKQELRIGFTRGLCGC